jgi:hypothetical protein
MVPWIRTFICRITELSFSDKELEAKFHKDLDDMYAMYGLFGNEPGLSVVHPGITLTNISAHHPPFLFHLIKHPMKIIFMSPKKACLSILAGIFDHCRIYEWIGPKWFDIWGFPKKKPLNSCISEEASWIFETAERLYQQMRESDSGSTKIQNKNR